MLLKKKDNKVWKVAALDSGLSVYPMPTVEESSRDGVLIFWESIKEIIAYKRDLFTIDLVCLRVYHSNDQYFEINEELIDFDALLDQLPERLRGFPERKMYWGKLIQPAFAENEMQLWHR